MNSHRGTCARIVRSGCFSLTVDRHHGRRSLAAAHRDQLFHRCLHFGHQLGQQLLFELIAIALEYGQKKIGDTVYGFGKSIKQCQASVQGAISESIDDLFYRKRLDR